MTMLNKNEPLTLEQRTAIAQATELFYNTIVNNEKLLHKVQDAYFYVCRKLIGFNPRKAFTICPIRTVNPCSMHDDPTSFGGIKLGAMKDGYDLYFRIDALSNDICAELTDEMETSGIALKDIETAIGNLSGLELTKMFQETYGKELMAYAKTHKGGGGLPKNWQSAI